MEKEQIGKAIEYLNQVSIIEPSEIRVEEIEANRIVLSFREKSNYLWQNERQMREFTFDNGEVSKMLIFPKS